MRGVSLLIKPTGSLCNLRCRYCFYREEREAEGMQCGEFMSPETLRAVFEKLLAGVAGPCNIVFQGGEPTLCGLDFYRKALELERQYVAPDAVITNAIQTNGVLLDEEWAKFLADERFLVGISLDGPQALHDRYRVDASGVGTHERVMQAIRLLRRFNVEFNTLSVVTEDSCKEAESMYRFFAENDLFWQQYIPVLEPYHTDEPQPWSLVPAHYGRFLKTMFRLWYRDVSEGRPVYNRYFDNLTGILCGRMPEACDMRGFCSPQYVIEADGSVYPCDFYAVEKWLLGNIQTDSAQAIQNAAKPFLTASLTLPEGCRTCEWLGLCRGGCRRRRDTETGCEKLCEAYHTLFPYAYPELAALARKLTGKN